jgi:hypothetical protein
MTLMAHRVGRFYAAARHNQFAYRTGDIVSMHCPNATCWSWSGHRLLLHSGLEHWTCLRCGRVIEYKQKG